MKCSSHGNGGFPIFQIWKKSRFLITSPLPQIQSFMCLEMQLQIWVMGLLLMHAPQLTATKNLRRISFLPSRVLTLSKTLRYPDWSLLRRCFGCKRQTCFKKSLGSLRVKFSATLIPKLRCGGSQSPHLHYCSLFRIGYKKLLILDTSSITLAHWQTRQMLQAVAARRMNSPVLCGKRDPNFYRSPTVNGRLPKSTSLKLINCRRLKNNTSITGLSLTSELGGGQIVELSIWKIVKATMMNFFAALPF